MLHARRGSVALLPGTWLAALAITVGCQTTRPHLAYYDDGAKMEEGSLVGGLQSGLWSYFHENGVKKAEGLCAQDLQIGKWQYWYSDGTPEMVGSFADQHRVGEWIFYAPNGTVTARGHYRDGLEDGLWSFFRQDGSLEQRGFFDGGRTSSGWTYWHPNGTLKATGFYYLGDKVGRWAYRDANGLDSTRDYDLPLDRSGNEFQLVVERWEDGSIRREGLAQGSRQIGGWTTRHRGGKLRSAGRFVGGRPEGNWSFWAADGSLVAQGEVKNGRPGGEWQVAVESELRTKTMDASRPLPPFRGEWSEASLGSTSPETATSTWLAEASSPPGLTGSAEPVASSGRAPSAALEASVRGDLGAAATPSPLSPAERDRIEDIVMAYGTQAGAKELEQSPLAGRSYGGVRRRSRSESTGESDLARSIEGRRLDGEFVTAGRERVAFQDLRGSNVLLIVLRGFYGDVCVYCVAQTAAYSGEFGAYEGAQQQLDALNTKTYLMYPGPAAGVEEFQRVYCQTFGTSEVPCTLVYDTNMQFIDQLGISGSDLAKPTTLLIDAEGVVRWAYVGENIADRPPIETVLEQIRALDGRRGPDGA